MNNFCTNCGNKLEKGDLVCKKCNTPIVDLPYNYNYVNPKKKEMINKILIVICICIVCIVAYNVVKVIMHKIKINKLEKEYVVPYMKANYTSVDYSLKYDHSGRCLISGNCYFDLSCDGRMCEKYSYLDEKECTSYYYRVEINEERFTLTVVEKNKQYYVVKGENIYGEDEEKEDIINNDLDDVTNNDVD